MRAFSRPANNPERMQNMKTKLYAHTTDGGAQYLMDAFVKCPNGHKEGVFEGAKYIIRLDGHPEIVRAPEPAKKNHGPRARRGCLLRLASRPNH